MEKTSFITLVVLDGWGINPSKEGNAIAQAKIPIMNELQKSYPICALQASGIAVGLPWGKIGNSEVGHLNLGAGFILYQSLPRISLAIQNGSFFQNKVFLDAIEYAKRNSSKLHLIGLVSTGGVHSHMEHLFALLELASKNNFKKEVYIHMFTDGRDTSPQSALKYLKELEAKMKKLKTGKIASISGRNYAMDRNNNWNRTKKTYDVIVYGRGVFAKNPKDAIKNSYKKGLNDQYIEPSVILDKKKPIALIEDKDSIIFFNFRADRARQLTETFVQQNFNEFETKKFKKLHFVTMTQYKKNFKTNIAFPPQYVTNPLAKIISDQGFKQLHIAETEKYAHVTYFFNGQKEKPFKNEDRILIPSPSVSNYEQTPEMSAYKITERLIEEINKNKYQFILVNYANADMIGHTGNFKAAVKAVEVIDKCIGRIIKVINSKNGIALITADHGNIEDMIDYKTKKVTTDHSNNPVPFILVDQKKKEKKDDVLILKTLLTPAGVLADVAPTILELMNIKKPKEMTGISLLKSLI